MNFYILINNFFNILSNPCISQQFFPWIISLEGYIKTENYHNLVAPIFIKKVVHLNILFYLWFLNFVSYRFSTAAFN